MDLNIAKQEFLLYVKKFNNTNFHIKRKIDHSLRVMELSKKIAENLKLNNNEIEIAALIGLLHDIGRFEQITKYHTFNDSISLDHGDFGVDILKRDNYIRHYITEEKFDDIIYTAIRNHNKFKIEDDLEGQKLLFSRIIRDADKMDILYQGTCISWSNTADEVENGKLIKDIIKPFLDKRPVNRKEDFKQQSAQINNLIIVLGFTFDFNFNISYKLLKQYDYMNKIIDRFNFRDIETKTLIEEIRSIINTYIDTKQKG